MNRNQAVAARGGMDESGPQPGLELVEAAPQSQQRRVHGRMRGVVAEQARLDQVSCRRRLGTLREEQHESSLLLGQSGLLLAQSHRAPRRIELQPAETVIPGAACS